MPEFCSRLEALLRRHRFTEDFIEREMKLVKEGYVVSKTNSKSMLGIMNNITLNIEAGCLRFNNYEAINTAGIEDAYTRWLTRDASRPGGYRRTMDFWKEKNVIKQ
jgi:hypothetical protein